MVERALFDPPSVGIVDEEVWTCLTCGACSARCPAQVAYNEFSRMARVDARERGDRGINTHAGALQAIAEIQTVSDAKKNMQSVIEGLKVSEKSEFLYFVGCQPFYNIIFKDIGVDTLASVRAALSLLNSIGIAPMISPYERCCGHDAYWTGDEETFLSLAKRNLDMIKESGAKTVLFSCPEGYATFAQVYPKYFGALQCELKHILELLPDKYGNNGEKLNEANKKVTYQDPCRLGRFSGIYDQPRALLKKVPGVELTEMASAGSEAICCGSSAWINCTRIHKKIQMQRLGDAAHTGADVLITACPKCQIHLKCAQHDGESGDSPEIIDIFTFLANSLGG